MIADLLTGAAAALIVVFVLAGMLFPPREWPTGKFGLPNPGPHRREVPRGR